MSKQQKVYQCWIDYMKIIGMLFIVWGHFFPKHLSNFIYSFSVPLFFFISGYLCNNKKYSWKEFLVKQLKTLLIPMSLLCSINLALRVLLNHITSMSDFLYSMGYSLLGFHSYNNHLGLGGLWFVYTLFLLKVLDKLLSKRFMIFVALILLCLHVILGVYNMGAKNSFIALPLALPFYVLGKVSSCKKIYFSPFTSAIGIALLIILANVNGKVMVFCGDYGHSIFLYLCNGLLGIYCIWYLCLSLNKYAYKGVKILASGNILILCGQGYGISILNRILLDGLENTEWLFDLFSFGRV